MFDRECPCCLAFYVKRLNGRFMHTIIQSPIVDPLTIFHAGLAQNQIRGVKARKGDYVLINAQIALSFIKPLSVNDDVMHTGINLPCCSLYD